MTAVQSQYLLKIMPIENVTPVTHAGIDKAARTVGSQEEVDALLADFGEELQVYRRPDLEGWRYVGSGSYRSAFLSPTGVIYKTLTCLNFRMQQREVTLFEKLADYPWVLPATLWWGTSERFTEPEPVVALPFVVQGRRTSDVVFDAAMDEIRHYFGDLGRYNVLTNSLGEPVLVDGGNAKSPYNYVSPEYLLPAS